MFEQGNLKFAGVDGNFYFSNNILITHAFFNFESFCRMGSQRRSAGDVLHGADVPGPEDLILLHGGSHNAALLHSGAVLRDIGRNSTGVAREARRQTAQENANFALALRILDEDSKAPPMRPKERAPGPTVEALLREERRRHAAWRPQ